MVFTWGIEDMLGIDREIITHKIFVNLAFKPIQQRKRYLSVERRKFVKEVHVLLKIGHIPKVLYLE